MKYSKWTVALAALGVVSLASAAKAEEQPSSVKTALSGTTISGYVDTSAEWNFGTGNANLPPYKFNNINKADGFNLDVVQLRIDKPLDESDWAAGYRVDLWFGPDANTLGTTSMGIANANSDFAIRQAYVVARAPIGTGLDLKMGVFDSIIGYESVDASNDPNFTRSYGHSIEPQTMTGLLASYRFCDSFSVSGGVADTWNSTINDRAFAPVNDGLGAYSPGTEAESYKAYMASVALTAPDSMGFLSGSTLYAGFVNGFADVASVSIPGNKPLTVASYYVGATVATPVTGLRAGAAVDYLDIHPANNDDYSIAGYLSYQATEKLSFHARAEYFKDKVADNGTTLLFGNVGAGNRAEVLSLTGTAQYDLWKNVISRLELRWDHSLAGNDLFGGQTSTPNSENAWLLAANIIYKF
jgi:Putative beta-barrel porin-2, OmpL-like. bbp2